jgi:hypothetical protein
MGRGGKGVGPGLGRKKGIDGGTGGGDDPTYPFLLSPQYPLHPSYSFGRSGARLSATKGSYEKPVYITPWRNLA